MSKNCRYKRIPDTSTTTLEIPHEMSYRRNNREFIHHRSILFGIFIGLAFAIITLLTLLPSLSINYFDMQQMTTTFAGRRNEDASSLSLSSSESTDTMLNLYENVRVLCLVFTYKENFEEKAYWVNKTWGKRCNRLLFMSNETDSNNLIDVTVLNISESHDELWGKTKETFKYAYEHHLNEYDWFLKADDDTYVIMENLRYFLYSYPTDLPLYFGFEFNDKYMSGGAGYVLSIKSLKLLIEEGINDSNKCKSGTYGPEDFYLGMCLAALNVTMGDTRDELLQERFFPIMLDYLLDDVKINDTEFWYFSLARYKHNSMGLKCCSKTAISFHYVNKINLLMFEFLLYNLRVQKEILSTKELPVRYSKDDVDIMFSKKDIGLNPVNSSVFEQ